MLKNKKISIIILSIPIVLILGVLVYFMIKGITYIDNSVLKFVSDNISHSALEAMKIVTNLCSLIIFMLVIILIGIQSKNKKIAIVYTINLSICYLLNTVIKLLIARPRPIYMLIEESGNSFPSAHSMLSVAFYGFLAYLIINYIKNKPLKISLVILCILFTLLVGISRICLCVHYPSDVLCGFLFGYIYLIVYIKCTKNYMLNIK